MNANLQIRTSGWATLYKLGGVSALLLVLIIVIQGFVYAIVPQPLDGTALEWFMLFQKNNLIGLIDFELLMVIYTILSIPIFLSLYILLRHITPAWTTIYLILNVIGVMCFIAARPAFEMLSLSNGYNAAATEAERVVFIAAGEAKLATFHGTAFHISYLLGSITGLIISLVMLKTNLFSKRTAYVRIASSIFDFGLYVPTVGLYISMFSVVFLFIWNIMIAWRLFQVAKDTSKEVSSEMERSFRILPTHVS